MVHALNIDAIPCWIKWPTNEPELFKAQGYLLGICGSQGAIASEHLLEPFLRLQAYIQIEKGPSE